MVPWGSSIRRRDQRWRHTFLDLFQKYHFFPMWFMPTNPHWSAAAWGTCCGHSPCPQRLCTMVSAPDHPLYAYMTPTAVVPGRNLHLSAMCICRGCAFHPGYLPFASPSAVPQPAHASGSEADFWSPGPQPAGPDHPGQGVAQIKSLEVLLCPSQPPWPP